MWRQFPYIPSLLNVFLMKRCCVLSHAFSASIPMIVMIVFSALPFCWWGVFRWLLFLCWITLRSWNTFLLVMVHHRSRCCWFNVLVFFFFFEDFHVDAHKGCHSIVLLSCSFLDFGLWVMQCHRMSWKCYLCLLQFWGRTWEELTLFLNV